MMSIKALLKLAAKLGVLVSIPLFSNAVQAQTHAQLSSNDTEAFLSPDYISLIDQVSLDELRMTMQQIWKEGLNPLIYWNADMERDYQQNAGGSHDLKTKANQNFLRLLQDISLGSFDPQLMGFDVKMTKKKFISASELQLIMLTTGAHAQTIIDAMIPQNAAYMSVREALRKIYSTCSDGTWSSIKIPKKTLKLGVHSDAIPDLKKRLALLGYKVSSFDDAFDGDVLSAVNDIQWNLRIKPDGVISPGGKTWGFFNVPCMVRVRQLQADMEKMRWFPSHFEDRYIFINLAMAYFVLIDKDPAQIISMSFRTINGRPARKSPTMRDEIVTVILNPFWIVPPTIFMQDKVAEIVNLSPLEISNYFATHNYEVWNKSFTQQLDPASIDWFGINEGTVVPDIYIRQRPHLGNALGVIKFELTNSFSVYLHDTNQRDLFALPQRQLSSGCIRLERPLDLAEYLLQGTAWSRAAIQAVLAKPGQVLTKSTEIHLKKKMPVYTVYLTSQMSSDGIIRFVEDSYGQNAVIQKLMPQF